MVVNASLRQAAQRVIDVWIWLQVELNGEYSVKRLVALHEYSHKTSWLRVIFFCVVTPLPCLILVILADLIPLAHPSEGIFQNYVFWIRDWIICAFITIAALEQFRNCLPKLPISNRAMAAIVVSTTTIGIAWQILASHLIGFPLPFCFSISACAWAPSLVCACYYLWRDRLRADPSLKHDLARYILVFSCQVALTLIYPLYIHVFESLDAIGQTFFVLMLPVIKITTKNWISRSLRDVDDLKPEVVIFNVEIFNALYMSCSMQNSASYLTSVAIIAVDMLQAWISVWDVTNLLNELHSILDKVEDSEAKKALKGRPFMDLCIELLEDPQVRNHERVQSLAFTSFSLKLPARPTIKAADSSRLTPAQIAPSPAHLPLSPAVEKELHETMRHARHSTSPTSVAPYKHPKTQQPKQATLDEVQDFSSPTPTSPLQSLTLDERINIVKRTTQVLFIIEFVVLIEFTEVIVPIIYSMYVAAMSNLPNRQFYPQLAKLSDDRLDETVINVLAYSFVEFLSFLTISVILRRKIKISTLHQLAFVLDTHRSEVQSKLVLWTFYVVQSMLFHYGVDFSMQFEWLKYNW